MQIGCQAETVSQGSAATVPQAAQRAGRCPSLGNIQGRVAWGSGQPDGLQDVLASGRGFGLDDLHGSLRTSTSLARSLVFIWKAPRAEITAGGPIRCPGVWPRSKS